jgi:ribose transport system substrate-binding protein
MRGKQLRHHRDASGRRRRAALARISASLVSVALVAAIIAGASSGHAVRTKSAQIARSSRSSYVVTFDKSYKGLGQDRNFLTLVAPPRKPGVKFKVGFLLPTAVQPNLDAGAAGAKAQVEKLGGTLLVEDAEDSAATQASQLQQLISEHVNAVIVPPLVPQTLLPGIEQARAKGIAVVGIASYFNETQPAPKGYQVNIGPGYDYSAYEIAKAVAKAKPGASFATMGLGFPVPVLTYLIARQTYWAEHFGLKYLGTVDAASDSTSGWVAAANSVLSKYPTMNVLLPYDDTAGIAAAAAAQQQGKQVLIATPNGGASIDKAAVEAGKLADAYNTPWHKMGQQAAVAAYMLVTKDTKHLDRVINTPSAVTNKSNVTKVILGG